ncbi:MAG: arsenate reductase ArsC [Bdellovibrionales bacterium]|nr:arsenate reductase ArsC [Bdellovibrionales bacterium]
MNILFMCVANSARSQMAEGIARDILDNHTVVQSAGSHPTQVNPLAVTALDEIGIDISKHSSKTVEQINSNFLENLDFIITLCDEEVCPVLNNPYAQKLHWPFPDPAIQVGTDEEQLDRFRAVRNGLRERIMTFANARSIEKSSSSRETQASLF